MGIARRADRGNTWWFKFKLGGQRHRGVCKVIDVETGAIRNARTKGEAIEAEAMARKAARSHASRPGLARHGAYTLGMAIGQHVRRVKPTASASHVASLERIGTEMLRHFGIDRPLVEILQSDVIAYTEFLTQQKRRVWIGGPRRRKGADNPRFWKTTDKPRSLSEVNHCLDVLRAVLQGAHRTLDPASGKSLLPYPPDVPALDEPARDPTPMSEAEYRARTAAAPPWVRDATALAWWFGLRLDEILTLELRHIDRENQCLRLLGAETKGKRDEPVFGGDKGWTLLRWLERQARRRGQVRLVTWPGPKWARLPGQQPPREAWRPLTTIKRSWGATGAGIDQPRRFHDLRAAYITNVARIGSAKVTKELARHASMATTERYIKLVDNELATAANLAARRRTARGRASG